MVLRGVGLGGWMNMENFITGYPANETKMRAAHARGARRRAATSASSTLLSTLLRRRRRRVPRGARAELRAHPLQLPPLRGRRPAVRAEGGGLRRLDRAVDACAPSTASTRSSTCTRCPARRTSTGTRTTRPTGRRSGSTGTSRTASSPVGGARRPLQGQPVVAGYNPINEPARRVGVLWASSTTASSTAIRAIDPEHVALPRRQHLLDRVRLPRRAAAEHRLHAHDYALPGFAAATRTRASPGAVLRPRGLRADLPPAHGVHAPYRHPDLGRRVRPGLLRATDARRQRYQLLDDQLDIYSDTARAGRCGPTRTSACRGWSGRARLAVRAAHRARDEKKAGWASTLGIDRPEVPDLSSRARPGRARVADFAFPDPRGTADVRTLVRHILSPSRLAEYAEHFRDLSRRRASTSWPSSLALGALRDAHAAMRPPGLAHRARRPGRPDHHTTKEDLMSRSNFWRQAWACRGSALGPRPHGARGGSRAGASAPRGLRDLAQRPRVQYGQHGPEGVKPDLHRHPRGRVQQRHTPRTR